MPQLTVEQMYARYGAAIYSRCMRLLKDEPAAEDATQEVFLKVLRHAASAPAANGLMPWIHRISTNHCLNLLRDARRHAIAIDALPELVDYEFEEDLLTRDFAQRVLSSTPEHVRAPALLYYGHGLEQSKVALALGISRRTVLYRLAAFTKGVMELHELAQAGE
jgi:RNA polymerase sigma-70 factor (ECF subfamily)